MQLIRPAGIVFVSNFVHLQDYLVASNVDLLVLNFFDEIVKLLDVVPKLF